MEKFEDLLIKEKPVLVDFFAQWCGPCVMMSPILEQVKKELGEKIEIIKVDVDKNRAIASKYQIRDVPTFMLFKKGKLLWRQSGMLYKEDLINIIKQYTSKQKIA